MTTGPETVGNAAEVLLLGDCEAAVTPAADRIVGIGRRLERSDAKEQPVKPRSVHK